MDEEFELRIRDDGRGFDAQAVVDSSHYGLEFMGERVEALEGEFSIDSEPGSGTTITISVPYAPVDELTTASNLV